MEKTIEQPTNGSAQPPPGTLTATEARAILETEAKTRVTECQAEVQKVLDKYQCAIDVAVILKAGQVIPQVQIVARGN